MSNLGPRLVLPETVAAEEPTSASFSCTQGRQSDGTHKKLPVSDNLDTGSFFFSEFTPTQNVNQARSMSVGDRLGAVRAGQLRGCLLGFIRIRSVRGQFGVDMELNDKVELDRDRLAIFHCRLKRSFAD